MPSTTIENPIELRAQKEVVVNKMFIQTADDNYVVARWCFQQNTFFDFYWLILHALEKYIKAIKLLNGKTAQNLNHNIVSSYRDIESEYPELVLKSFERPNWMESASWKHIEPLEMVRQINEVGDPNNRYALFGISREPLDDLIKIDQLIYSVRRMCRKLSVEDGLPTSSDVLELLKSDKAFWLLKENNRLERILRTPRCSEAEQRALAHLNSAFLPTDDRHDKNDTISMLHYTQSPLAGVFSAVNTHNPEKSSIETTLALISWMTANIYMPKKTTQELGDIEKQLRAKISCLT